MLSNLRTLGGLVGIHPKSTLPYLEWNLEFLALYTLSYVICEMGMTLKPHYLMGVGAIVV